MTPWSSWSPTRVVPARTVASFRRRSHSPLSPAVTVSKPRRLRSSNTHNSHPPSYTNSTQHMHNTHATWHMTQSPLLAPPYPPFLVFLQPVPLLSGYCSLRASLSLSLFIWVHSSLTFFLGLSVLVSLHHTHAAHTRQKVKQKPSCILSLMSTAAAVVCVCVCRCNTEQRYSKLASARGVAETCRADDTRVV